MRLLAGSLVTALAVVVAGCPGIPNDGRYQGGSSFRAMAAPDSPATIADGINRGDAADTLAASTPDAPRRRSQDFGEPPRKQ
jgi:hypothetical protein